MKPSPCCRASVCGADIQDAVVEDDDVGSRRAARGRRGAAQRGERERSAEDQGSPHAAVTLARAGRRLRREASAAPRQLELAGILGDGPWKP